MRFPQVEFSLPGWVEEFLAEPETVYADVEERMRLVIELSWLNVDHDTGGPFGAGIFDLSTNRLVAPGVNLVTTSNLSTTHAEMVAIMVAQRVVGHFGLPTSWSPARSHARSASARHRGRAYGDWYAGPATRTRARSASTRGRNCPTGRRRWRSVGSP